MLLHLVNLKNAFVGKNCTTLVNAALEHFLRFFITNVTVRVEAFLMNIFSFRHICGFSGLIGGHTLDEVYIGWLSRSIDFSEKADNWN